jgi:polyvinyl alcohol dehydrogenase (cytochrome)
MNKRSCVLTAVTLVSLSVGVRSQQPPAPVRSLPPDASTADGLFSARCAGCHGNGTTPGPNGNAGARPAPVLADLRTQSTDSVYRAVDDGGVMAVHARGLSPYDRRRLAEWVTGKPLPALDLLAPTQGKCTASPPPLGDWEKEPVWAGWSSDTGNGRFQTAARAGLKAPDIPRLKVKWAFAFPTAMHADSQPAVAGGRVFVGSETGLVYAIDARSGCFYWAFAADASVRTGIMIGRAPQSAGSALLYFGDIKANVYAVDARSGKLQWKQKIEDHPLARITGTPVLAEGRLYVPLSGLGEEVAVNNPNYECCTFRGSVVSMDALTGKINWKTYVIPQTPQPTIKNSLGVQHYAPAGASIWSPVTVDLARGAVYVGTGNSFTQPAVPESDAVLAFSLNDGRLLWKNQLTAGDSVGAGPDVDIGAPLILRKLPDGKSVLVVGQKSGDVYGLDPDRQGAQMWKVSVSRGGMLGGIEWGMAADDRVVYVPISDYPTPPPAPVRPESGLLVALDLQTGAQIWSQKPTRPCPSGTPDCYPAKVAAVTATPDAVFSGSMDGYLRAYSTKDGHLIAEYNTAVEFTTVNGVRGKGGSISGQGPAVAGGLLFVNSGYARFGGVGGNVLLAFAPE